MAGDCSVQVVPSQVQVSPRDHRQCVAAAPEEDEVARLRVVDHGGARYRPGGHVAGDCSVQVVPSQVQVSLRKPELFSPPKGPCSR